MYRLSSNGLRQVLEMSTVCSVYDSLTETFENDFGFSGRPIFGGGTRVLYVTFLMPFA